MCAYVEGPALFPVHATQAIVEIPLTSDSLKKSRPHHLRGDEGSNPNGYRCEREEVRPSVQVSGIWRTRECPPVLHSALPCRPWFHRHPDIKDHVAYIDTKFTISRKG